MPEPSPSTLLLVRSPGDERVVPRIVAELSAGAWNVVEVGPDPQLERIALAELASSHAASAALRVRAADATIELWIARVQGAAEGSLETLSAADSDPRVPALRVTEALRARGLIAARPRASPAREEAAAPPASEPQAQPAQPAAARTAAGTEADQAQASSDVEDEQREQDEQEEIATPPRPLPAVPRLWIELAPAFAISAGGVKPALDGFASVRFQPAQRWSLVLFALVPIWSARLQADEGSARVSTLLLGAGADLHLQSRRFELGLGGGAGGAFTFMHGVARTGFRSGDETVLVAAVFAGPSLHFHVGGGFRASARVFGGLALPRVAVRFAAHDVAHWGQPFGVATLGLEYAF